jgi:hypothetical protein
MWPLFAELIGHSVDSCLEGVWARRLPEGASHLSPVAEPWRCRMSCRHNLHVSMTGDSARGEKGSTQPANSGKAAIVARRRLRLEFRDLMEALGRGAAATRIAAAERLAAWNHEQIVASRTAFVPLLAACERETLPDVKLVFAKAMCAIAGKGMLGRDQTWHDENPEAIDRLQTVALQSSDEATANALTHALSFTLPGPSFFEALLALQGRAEAYAKDSPAYEGISGAIREIAQQ